MKELTIEQKAKLYDEALERARKLHKDAIYMDDSVHIKQYESIFPELKENDEKIKKALIDIVYDTIGDSFWVDYGVHKEEAVAWLEKQHNEQKPIINVPSREVILAIWDLGNEWKELTNGSISTEYGTQLYYIQKHWHESEYYLQKKQGEQKVSYTTIVETGDGGINALVTRELPIDGCDGKQEPTDKIEPKFKNGQWIVWQDECYKVSYNGCGYELVDKNGLSILLDYGTIDENAHLWDVTKDAKDGDVLVDKDDNIGIYKEIEGICWHSYIYLSFDNYLHGFNIGGSHVQNNTKPATKEQRDLLFQEIEEAGYEWDKDKKKPKKIKKSVFEPDALIQESYEQQADDLIDMVTEKSTWSEEDWNYIADLISYFNGSSLQHDTLDVISWLKSFKPQNMWEPSDEQVKALHHLNLTGNISYAGQGQTLIELYNDLKKLKEE